ncbi:MAG: hypothetical protein H7326_00225 [Bdellovibrionaceae bacterium]|nr:hypothetical protein [Pseudobdellovibrionaceae bacterium]
MNGISNKRHVTLSNRGSVMLTALIFGAFVVGITGSFISFMSYQLKQQSRTQAKEDVMNLSTTLKMLYSDGATCKKNLSEVAWGNTLVDLQARSQSGGIKFLYPDLGAVSGVMLSTGLRFKNAKVTSVGFTNLTQVHAPDTTYIAELSVSTEDSSGRMIRAISVPFYIVTDASGKLTDCYTTSFPFFSSPDPIIRAITMEDYLCAQALGGDAIFVPQSRSCLPKSMVVGRN